MQRSIMRISTPYDEKSGNKGKNIFINRKGTVTAGNLEAAGIRIWNRDEVNDIDTEGAMNGGYYFVDSILVFDAHTKNALRTRLRFMGHTLSPDFINSGARAYYIRRIYIQGWLLHKRKSHQPDSVCSKISG